MHDFIFGTWLSSNLATPREVFMFKVVPGLIQPLMRAAVLAMVIMALPPRATADTNEHGWLTRHWLSDDGLPNNTVSSIAQTPDGFLWLATANVLRGLARFDGVRFEEFSSTNFISPPDRGIVAITVTPEGGVRLATDRASIVCLDRAKQRVFTTAQGLPNQTAYSLIVDSEQALWVTYRDGSVARILADGMVVVFSEEDGLPSGDMICSMVNDERGRLWFAKNGQLGVFRDDELKFETLLEIDIGPTRLAAARGGGVWVGCGIRLLRFNEGGPLEDFGELKPRRGGTEISALVESLDGAVWIGTTFSGLFRHYDRAFTAINTTHQEILAVMEDREGNLWVGTGGGGLNQVRSRAMQLHTAIDGLPFDSVQSLTEDTNGVIWAVTQDGSLSKLMGNRWHTIPTDGNWSGDGVCVRADVNGDLWMGTRHGLMRWRDGRPLAWGDARQIKIPTIHALVVATNGDVWFGGETPAVITRLRDGVIKDFAVPPDIRVIRAAAEDAAGNIWFGTSKGNLLRVEGERIVEETSRTTGEPQPIRSLSATRDGGLWIGYAGEGVGLWKNGRYTPITARQGLFDDFVSQIVADDRGWMWFGANRGVFKVRRSELEGLASGRTTQVRSIHYGQADGLPGLQANFGNTPNSLRSRDGRIFLAMRTALAVVDVAKLRINAPPPQVLLKRMMVGDRIVADYASVASRFDPAAGTVNLANSTNRVRVPPEHRRVEFIFTALSFVGPEKLAFRYRLEGVDEDWVMTDGVQRNAVYPRLPNGDYKFQVGACNSEGTWSDSDAEIAFVVTPFVWNTWWFRAMALLTFTGIIIAIVRYVSFRRLRLQLRHLEEQATLHKERARIAKDIHDDLGASLTQISLIGELARQDRDTPEKVGTHVETISNTARRAVKSLDEIVWAVNPRNDTLAHFIDYTGQFALDYLRLAGMRCRLDLPEQTPARELSTDVRHNLFLVVKEAINNTVKHAHATELRLRIAITEEKLQIVIEDNGQGFDQTPAADGADGLHNMRARLADIGGNCWIQGRPGAGAKVTVEFPWPASPVN